MEVQVIPLEDTIPYMELWPNKKIWIFYLKKLGPMAGPMPDINQFINIEKQYLFFNKTIASLQDPIPENKIDNALDSYNIKLNEWKEGSIEMRSLLVELNKNELSKIEDLEKCKGFVKWIQSEKIQKIKNFINSFKSF